MLIDIYQFISQVLLKEKKLQVFFKKYTWLFFKLRGFKAYNLAKLRAKKTCFLHLIAYILWLMLTKVLKFLPHIIVLVLCKIFNIGYAKFKNLNFFVVCIKNGSFVCFLTKKNDLGTLGV